MTRIIKTKSNPRGNYYYTLDTGNARMDRWHKQREHIPLMHEAPKCTKPHRAARYRSGGHRVRTLETGPMVDGTRPTVEVCRECGQVYRSEVSSIPMFSL